MDSKPSRKFLTLLRTYARAYDSDSWKGGGDPADWPEIEARLKQAEAAIHEYVAKLEAKVIGDLTCL